MTRRGSRLAAICTLALSACSFTLNTVEERYHAKDVPTCDHSRAKPKFDAFAATLLVATGIGLLAMPAEDSSAPDQPRGRSITGTGDLSGPAGALSLGIGAMFATGAVEGWRRTRRCRVAIAAHRRRIESQRIQRSRPRASKVMPRSPLATTPTPAPPAVPQPPPPAALAQPYAVHFITESHDPDRRRGVRIMLGDPATGRSCAVDSDLPIVELRVWSESITAPAIFPFDGSHTGGTGVVCPTASTCHVYTEGAIHLDAFTAGKSAAGSFTLGSGPEQLAGTFSAIWCTPVDAPTRTPPG